MKKLKIEHCYDCTYAYDLHIRNCVWCNLMDKKIENLDIIHPDCELEEY